MVKNNVHNKASLNISKRKPSKEELEAKKRAAQYLKDKEKLQSLLEKRMEAADKEEAKQKKIAGKKNKDINSQMDTSIIPTISLKEFKKEEKPKVKKESFLTKLLNKIKENRIKRQEAKKIQKEEAKALKESKNMNALEASKKKEELAKAKEEKKTLILKQREEEKERKLKEKKEKEEKIRLEKERIKAEKEAKKKALLLEKERKDAEKNLLNTKNLATVKPTTENVKINEKEEAKRLAKEKKEAEKKEKLKQKYEEEARRKKEKEDREILQLSERREKEKKIKKEKEQARKERKEKALLIKKAQEESRQKARKERKTLQEKLENWYNNLAFVKDRKNRREMQRQTLLIDFEGADAVRSEEKIMYKYVAKNNETGKVETGYFAAFSKLDVHSFLMSEGFEVYEITPQKSIGKTLSLGSSKFNATELDFFLTQLSTFLKSGITLVESVKILSKQSKKRAHKSVYKSIIYELTMGENFSEALAKQGNVFPRLLINMVKTSELTGDLPETLDDMANYYKETEKTRKQMISAMTYPLVVLGFAVVILVFMLIKVIPQFVSIYDNLETDLPAITIIVLKASNFLRNKWGYLLAGILVFVIVFIILFKTIKVFKSLVQTLIMNTPVIGKIVIYNEVTMFTKTFASLLNHNVYITDCMEVLSKITNNEIYKMLIFDTMTNLAKGEAISNSFKNHWAFPTIAYEMILTGEKTGQLGVMMDKVADYYQEQHKNAVNQIKAFIEPVMIVLLAGIVGIILMSVVIPMFDMYEGLTQQT